jgi:hypothetical protein
MCDLGWTKWHWDRFFSELFGFPLTIVVSLGLHTHLSSGGWRTGLLLAAVQRHGLTPSTWTTTLAPASLTNFVLAVQPFLFERRPRIIGFGIEVARNIFWSKKDKVRSFGYYKEELPNEKACRSLTVFVILKFKTIGWARHVVLMRETRNACEISSSHGGEYDVQSCLLGCTAV